MTPEPFQTKLEALSNAIEEAIHRFEKETTSRVTGIAVLRNKDGGVRVKLSASR